MEGADGGGSAGVRVLLIDEDYAGCVVLSDTDGHQAIVLPIWLYGTPDGDRLIAEATARLAGLWPVLILGLHITWQP